MENDVQRVDETTRGKTTNGSDLKCGRECTHIASISCHEFHDTS
jgi:hypothetical protein